MQIALSWAFVIGYKINWSLLELSRWVGTSDFLAMRQEYRP